jgi:phosphatidylethanolamine-binding protein (PEBP) family uncharacterized protein
MPLRLRPRRLTKKRRSTKRRRAIRGGQLIFTVKYGTTRVNSQEIDKAITLEAPQINFKQSSNKLYTLLMWDPDAPAQPSWAHWIVINLSKPNNISDPRKTLLEYSPPSPPSGAHRYFFGLFEQTSGEINPSIPLRPNFNFREFIIQNNLSLVAELFMTVSF